MPERGRKALLLIVMLAVAFLCGKYQPLGNSFPAILAYIAVSIGIYEVLQKMNKPK